jgi:hypothetical protein
MLRRAYSKIHCANTFSQVRPGRGVNEIKEYAPILT